VLIKRKVVIVLTDPTIGTIWYMKVRLNA